MPLRGNCNEKLKLKMECVGRHGVNELADMESKHLYTRMYILYGEKFSREKIFADWPLAKIS